MTKAKSSFLDLSILTNGEEEGILMLDTASIESMAPIVIPEGAGGPFGSTPGTMIRTKSGAEHMVNANYDILSNDWREAMGWTETASQTRTWNGKPAPRRNR